jgi:hypothetical protein
MMLIWFGLFMVVEKTEKTTVLILCHHNRCCDAVDGKMKNAGVQTCGRAGQNNRVTQIYVDTINHRNLSVPGE